MTELAEESYKTQPHNTRLGHIPGDYGLLPYLGKSIELVTDLYAYVDKCYKQYGPVSRTKIGGKEGLLLIGPDIYKQIHLDLDKCFSTQMGYDSNLGEFYRGGLLLLDGDEHRFQRRMFQTAFKTEPMKGYVDIINPLFSSSLKEWDNKEDFLFFPSIKRTLLEVGSSVFIGVNDSDEEMERMNKAFLDISEKGLMGLFKVDLPGFKFHKGKSGKKYLENYFRGIIPQRRSGDGSDILSFLCREKMDNGEFFPESMIVPHTSFLLFAAHDTTTSTLSHIVLHTAMNPLWQDKMRAESLALDKEFLDYDDLAKLESLELVFKETLRLHPSVPLMTRRTIRDCEIGGYSVPANTMLYLPPSYTHTLPEYWTNPFEFDPNRFSAGRQEHKNHSFCYIPFGGGIHKCIGMHFANMMVKCFMHQLLINYDYSLPDNYQPKLKSFPLPKPGDDLPLILKKRLI